MLDNIPAEMRSYNQFVLWRLEDRGEGKPTKVPYSVNGYRADVNKPHTWSDFETAVNTLRNDNSFAGLGFVLTQNDPFTFIDLDNPYDPTKGFTAEKSQELLDRQIKIHQMFDSYSERSPSGTGLHIICKGYVEQGRKRGQIEVYSNQRFMTMTGDVFNNQPIQDRNELVNVLWSEMGKGVEVYATVEGGPQTLSDAAVCDAAYAASNGQKFYDLYVGNFLPHYSSQSEADFALINIVAFYTQNREQITRIFRASGLGQRGKANRDSYIEPMINRSFDRMAPPVDIEGLKIQIETAMRERAEAERRALESVNRPSDMVVNQTQASDMQTFPVPAVGNPDDIYEPRRPSYSRPKGLMGDIADFIESSANRPVPDVALAGAIGFMSGICGRAYNFSNTGLNTYSVLVADTGVGKDAISNGISYLHDAIDPFVKNHGLFRGPGDIASPQALHKHFHRHSKSFVAMPGEIGMFMQRICSPNCSPADLGIRKALLELFTKSGKGKHYGEAINSDKDKSTASVTSPALSILGESTPEEFYKSLDESAISSGFVPRFLIIETRAKRPKNVENPNTIPSDKLVKELCTLMTNALSLNEINQVIEVRCTVDADQLLKNWEYHCDHQIIKAEAGEEVRRQLWNRAGLNVKKLAALVAVGVSPYGPTIDVDCVNWAIEVVNKGVINLMKRFASGEIGNNSEETQQDSAAIKCIVEYLTKSFSDFKGYHLSPSMHSERIVPHSYLLKRLARSAMFKNDRAGGTRAIQRAIANLIDRGDIKELPRHDMVARFNTNAKGYMVSNPAVFGF